MVVGSFLGEEKLRKLNVDDVSNLMNTNLVMFGCFKII